MFAPVPLSPESREWLRKVGRAALAKLIVSAAVAVGTKLGEAAVDAILGKDKGDDSDDDVDTDDPEGDA